MADPLLKGEFPERSLNQAVGVAAMCLQEEPSVRPLIGDVVAALSFLAVASPQEDIPASIQALTSLNKMGDSNYQKDGSQQRNTEDGENISSSSRSSRCSSDGESEHHSPRKNRNGVEDQDGSVGSSVGNRKYEESSAWSIGSSSRYKSQDGSAFENSRRESIGSHSRKSSDSEEEH